jgi:hypothetical protein
MNLASERRTFEELVPDFEDFFNQNLVDIPIGRRDLHRNENQALYVAPNRYSHILFELTTSHDQFWWH